MDEYRTFRDRALRKPTWAERQRERTAPDVWHSVDQAPPAFWNAVVMAISWSLHSLDSLATSSEGKEWTDELNAHEGSRYSSHEAVRLLTGESVEPSLKITAIELLFDVMDTGWGVDEDFADRINDAAARFRVAVRFTMGRFEPTTPAHLQNETVRPTLQLLMDRPDLYKVDELYRKAWDRAHYGDCSGAITAAASAVEEMLRAIGLDGKSLEDLAKVGASRKLFSPGVGQLILKLDAFRQHSDAHSAGTDDFELGVLVLRVTGSIIWYLSQVRPKPL